MNTDNGNNMKREAEEWKLHWMAKVHNISEMWQGSQYIHATQKESHTENTQMPPVGYILDTKEIMKASWSNYHADGVAAYTLSERSPLQWALLAMHLTQGRTQAANDS